MRRNDYSRFLSTRTSWCVFGLLLFVFFLARFTAAASIPQVDVYYFDGWADTSASNSHVGSMPQRYPEREPLSGWYDNSAALVHQQIEWARRAGATFFIFDWYDTRRDSNPSDQTVNSAVAFFQKDPRQLGMKYALLYVNNGPFSIPQAEWKAACERWGNGYFKSRAYFKEVLIMQRLGISDRDVEPS